MKESGFQAKLIRDLKELFPGSIIMKTDPCYIQGIPDLVILYKGKWAALECKKSLSSSHRPNQNWWIDKMRDMSFASFIAPENREDVLHDLQRTFESAC